MAEIGHNSLTQEVFQKHVAAVARADAALKLAREVKNRARKAAKADGILLGELDRAVRIAGMTSAEQKEMLGAEAKYLRWLMVPVGAQMALFPEDDPMTEADPEDAEENARSKGFLAGISGHDEENPFDANQAVGMAWLDGYRAGRAQFDAEPADAEDA